MVTEDQRIEISPSFSQYRVLYELLNDGAGNVTIARRLKVTEDTVKSHIKALLRMSGYASRTELVVGVMRGDIAVKIPPEVNLR